MIQSLKPFALISPSTTSSVSICLISFSFASSAFLTASVDEVSFAIIAS